MDPLFLVKIPFVDGWLDRFVRTRRLQRDKIDVGHLVHCLTCEVWHKLAPSPFTVQHGSVTGYTRRDHCELEQHAREFADPESLSAFDLSRMSSRPVPVFEAGRRLGFVVSACPIVRLSRARGGFRARAEIDAIAAGRADYAAWLRARLSNGGVEIESVDADAGSALVLRRTAGESREAKLTRKPRVLFTGVLTVQDPAAFRRQLARGVGRHRAFGFGALLVTPAESRLVGSSG